jgi:cell division protein FtsZ
VVAAPEPMAKPELTHIEETVSSVVEEPVAQEEEIVLTAPEPAANVETLSSSDDELLLTPQVIVDEAIAGIPVPPKAVEEEMPEPQRRRWLVSDSTEEDEKPAPRIAASGGTLFERMSNIARSVAKADHDEGSKDPLDIPRFLNNQNNS